MTAVVLVAAGEVGVGFLVVLGQHQAGLSRLVCDCSSADRAAHQRDEPPRVWWRAGFSRQVGRSSLACGMY